MERSSDPESRDDGRRSLGSLLARALPDLRRWLLQRRGYARLGQESTADVVQSVCREALEARARFEDRGDEAFRGWLRALASRKLVDRARYWGAERRDASRRVELDVDLGAAHAGERPHEIAVGRELAERVARALAGLPRDQRRVLELQHGGSLSTADIARVLGKTENSVRILRHRAMARVADALESAPRR